MRASVHHIEQKRRDREIEREILNYPIVKAHSILFSASKGELIQMVFSFATDYARSAYPDTEREGMIESCELDGGYCKKWLLEEWRDLQKMYEELGYQFVVYYFERLNNRECSPDNIGRE